jgi:tRNA-dihydrouridine synthase 3
VLAARGALVKPWLWEDVAAGADRPRTPGERLAVYRRWVSHATETWGSDEYGWRRVRWFLEFHVDWWRRYVPEDVEITGENTMHGRSSFAPRDEAEAILQALEPDDLHRACDLILAPFEPPPIALTPSGKAPDPTAGGWG